MNNVSLNVRCKANLLAIAVVLVLLFAAGCGGTAVSPAAPAPTTTTQPAADITQVNHIIFTLQENRSFDSYFGKLPGVEGLPANASNPAADGTLIAAYHYH